MRFNHMEPTLPKGRFSAEFRADLESSHGGVFGWSLMPMKVLKLDTYLLAHETRAGASRRRTAGSSC